MVTKLITPELVTAYWFCPRKAFLLLRGDDGEPVHEYISVISQRAERNRQARLATINPSCPRVDRGERPDVIAGAIVKVSNFEARVDALVRENHDGSGARKRVEPYLAVGTGVTTRDQRIRLAAAGQVVAKGLRCPVPTGVILNTAGKRARVKLAALSSTIDPIIKILERWTDSLPSELPPIIINSHCQVCPYKQSCRHQAEKEDNLSLLDRMTPKIMNRLQRKGIFTVNQLSYLYKPRRNRKRRKRPPSGFDFPLQALALRNRKIYIHQTPSIPVRETEIFLDIEGVPDLAFDYLIGIIVVSPTRVERHSLWADTPGDEKSIFESLFRIVEAHPAAPIYHYGSYEPKSIMGAAKKYGIALAPIEQRLVNAAAFIFGKIYFPTRSNSLKDVGKYVGAAWSIPDASGLLSIAWRLQWDLSKDITLKHKIITYNFEDCEALRRVVAELRCIGAAAAERDDIDFADVPKQHSTSLGQSIHKSLEVVLKSAHEAYIRKRAGWRVEAPEGRKRRTGGVKGHQGFKRIIPKPTKIVGTRRPIKCPEHKGQPLAVSTRVFSGTIIDLVFRRSGVRKTITKYTGRGGFCPLCRRHYRPPEIVRLSTQLFGYNFQAWVIYQRIALRLPYGAIAQVAEELFGERISDGSIGTFILRFSGYYAGTERSLLKAILDSPVIHVDETRINVQGFSQYVWVLTDGAHVIFRLTETRESTVVQELLQNYEGTLISDFYPGYDAIPCKQQKCLVHLIRDLNDDLWKNPYNVGLEAFVKAFTDLITSIMADVQKYGLKERHLRKHKKSVEAFYRKSIDSCSYQDEILQKYQKRFTRYRESLFRFLDSDGIPWNNNMAERAIRHFAIQRKISGTFYRTFATPYLRLLGVAQSCRFQGKSFFAFMLSRKVDIGDFKARKRPQISTPVNRKTSEDRSEEIADLHHAGN